MITRVRGEVKLFDFSDYGMPGWLFTIFGFNYPTLLAFFSTFDYPTIPSFLRTVPLHQAFYILSHYTKLFTYCQTFFTEHIRWPIDYTNFVLTEVTLTEQLSFFFSLVMEGDRIFLISFPFY